MHDSTTARLAVGLCTMASLAGFSCKAESESSPSAERERVAATSQITTDPLSDLILNPYSDAALDDSELLVEYIGEDGRVLDYESILTQEMTQELTQLSQDLRQLSTWQLSEKLINDREMSSSTRSPSVLDLIRPLMRTADYLETCESDPCVAVTELSGALKDTIYSILDRYDLKLSYYRMDCRPPNYDESYFSSGGTGAMNAWVDLWTTYPQPDSQVIDQLNSVAKTAGRLIEVLRQL